MAGIAHSETGLSLDDPSLYLDRELSLLAFQWRVLEEARDLSNPLLERVKFLSILCSNLDEFFMVRAGVLRGMAENKEGVLSERMERISSEVRRILTDTYEVWRNLELGLAQAGIELRDYANLNDWERTMAETYFNQVVFPVLTPLALDTGRPFPHISNLSLNLAVTVRDHKGREKFARVKVPGTLPHLLPLNRPDHHAGEKLTFIWMEQLIKANLHRLFPGIEVVSAHPFRVTRDAEVEIQELESDDLLETVEEAIWQRRFRAVVQLQVTSDIPERLLEVLLSNLELTRHDVYQVDGPLDLSRLRQLLSLDRPELKDPPFVPHTPPVLQLKPRQDIFAVLRREDILLHHPYESFQPVVEFLRRAAEDPDVLAIKMTLYRVGRNSPIVESLLSAIENGKQVAVLVELKARFDEESNIEWARALESAGVHVVYGLVGLKVHSKSALVVRREGDAIRRYVHLGTGNYNPVTARLYTDLSFFTTDEQIGADVSDLFNYVTGYSAKREYHKLLVAPVNLRSRMEDLIQREILCARRGSGHLIFKMNSLEDPSMIRLLYKASQAGVRVDLLVRGICCLRPQVPGISDNIRVTSIVGRFLEHSRIYYFRNGGDEEIYVGSADLMGRNLDRRVELLFPVENRKLILRLRDEILGTYLADTRNARRLQPDGTYMREHSGGAESNSQAQFLRISHTV
jgi:polyphosphate kinase